MAEDIWLFKTGKVRVLFTVLLPILLFFLPLRIGNGYMQSPVVCPFSFTWPIQIPKESGRQKKERTRAIRLKVVIFLPIITFLRPIVRLCPQALSLLPCMW
jgi:hypothetical protein